MIKYIINNYFIKSRCDLYFYSAINKAIIFVKALLNFVVNQVQTLWYDSKRFIFHLSWIFPKAKFY